MAARKIVDNVYYVGAIDWQRRLFDSLIPLPDGTSYNAYLIQASEKTALIDTVDPEKQGELLENLKALGVENLDYIVANHAEQDHSGSIPRILDAYPESRVVTNSKCKALLKDHLLVSEGRFITVGDGDTLPLGDKTLEFVLAPWVHWPETMFTYIKEDRILFSCDFLGSHLAPSHLFIEDLSGFYDGAKRYYAEIMMPFRTNIRKHLERLKGIDIGIIAPSHGPIHLRPEPIMNAYAGWASDDVKNEVVLPYVSMHGSTEKMVDCLVEKLTERNVVVRPFDLVRTDLGKLAMALVDAATLVIGASTVLVGPHPQAVCATYVANALRPKIRFASVIGSYGWGSKMLDNIKAMLYNLKAEMLTPVIVKGYPKAQDLKALEQLADQILAKHKEAKIIQ
jgi:flavorubredoxin